MQWNYHKIMYFLKVAETLNFSRAAKELFISPQALNKQILQLEQELGEMLFTRSTRKVTLTPFGIKMQHAFLPARDAFLQASRSMEQYIEKRARTIRLGFFQALSKKEVITPISNYLLSCEPRLHIELLGGELDDMIDWLYQGTCDMVITNVHDFERWDHAASIPLFHAPAMLVISLYHPWMVKDEIALADMAEESFLLYSRKKELEQTSFYRTFHAKEREYAPNFSSLMATLELGTSYAVMPKLFESMTHADLRYLPLPAEYAFDYHMTAFYRPDNHFASLFENLRDVVEEGMIQIRI